MTIELTVSDTTIVQQFQESPYRVRIGLSSVGSEGGFIIQLLAPSPIFLPNVELLEQLDIKAAFCSACSASRAYERMVDAMQWLELFCSFPGVKALGVSGVYNINCFRFTQRDPEIVESFVARARQPSDRRPDSAIHEEIL